MDRVVVITGAQDPEMVTIANICRDSNIMTIQAFYDSKPVATPVTAENAYKTTSVFPAIPSTVHTAILAECDGPGIRTPLQSRPGAKIIKCDHHHPHDPGWNMPPTKFLEASTVGQVIHHLRLLGLLPSTTHKNTPPTTTSPAFTYHDGSWWHVMPEKPPMLITTQIALAAAADHCLIAAYKGQCPGIDPDHLMHWRMITRAMFQKTTLRELKENIARARIALLNAPQITLDPKDPNTTVADMRSITVPELPEAAAREGIAFIACPPTGPGKRRKIVIQAASPTQLEAFRTWATTNGLIDFYGGDPMRGFAGAYIP